MTETRQSKEILSRLFYTALDAVNGCKVVEEQLQRLPLKGRVAIIAIGKAAAAMALGAKNQLNQQLHSSLVITKAGHAESSLGWPCFESGHPIPNEKSLLAGSKLLEYIENIPADCSVLALVSGGTSALVEVLPESMGLEDLQKMNRWFIHSGLNIHDINRLRQSVSLIKGGKILNHFSHNKMTQFLISDVKDDDVEIIGSGLFVVSEEKKKLTAIPNWLEKFIQKAININPVLVDSYVVASNAQACHAIIEQAKQDKMEIIDHGQTLYGDVFELAEELAKQLISGTCGLHIWGGEPTISLPDKIGRGGRNQSLALSLACLLENRKDITVLVGATDGNDGDTEDSGAIVDGSTLKRGKHIGNAIDYLTTADAGTFLAEAGDLFSTGPTGTNVMDIVIAIKENV